MALGRDAATIDSWWGESRAHEPNTDSMNSAVWIALS